ncbi:unnamed protein product [Brassica rapa subsp. trilocularis]
MTTRLFSPSQHHNHHQTTICSPSQHHNHHHTTVRSPSQHHHHHTTTGWRKQGKAGMAAGGGR